MKQIKLSKEVADGLEAYGEHVFACYRAENGWRRDLGAMEALGLPMTASKITAALRGLNELRVSGELAARITDVVVQQHPQMASGFGAEMMRQYARTLWAYYYSDDDDVRETVYDPRMDSWSTAILAAQREETE